MEKQTQIGLLCAAIAAVLLVFAAFSTSWVKGQQGGIESKVGLRSVDICVDGSECTTVSFSEWEKSAFAPPNFQRFITLGFLSFLLCLATAFFLVILVLSTALRKNARWPVHPGSITLLLTIGLLIIGVITLALHPFKSAGWGTGPGFMILGAGDIAALAASLILGRSAPLHEDDWFE